MWRSRRMGERTMRITVLGTITIIAIVIIAVLIIETLAHERGQGPQQGGRLTG